jgi:DNA-binding winged helix-turn-helix (wHTH) protein
MQIPNREPPFGHRARMQRHIPEQAPVAVAMNNQVAQISRATAQPGAEIFFDESLSPICSVDAKEIHRLARFLPVLVLIPRPAAAHQVDPRKPSVVKSSSERSETTILLGVLGKAVERFKSVIGASTVAFGDVTVNFSTMEALRKGEPVVLTAKEFKTLKYLIQNARRVISRDELLNEVWGYKNYPNTRTVDNHILRLRQKLERDPSRPTHFRTMHGAGYKFLP